MGTPMPGCAGKSARAPPESVIPREILIFNRHRKPRYRKDSTVTSAQFIACRDHAAFLMVFNVLWDDPHSGRGESKSSGGFATGTKAIDMSEYNLTEGASLVPRVDALPGVTRDGDAFVMYAANGQTATYNVTGTLFSFSVDLLPPD